MSRGADVVVVGLGAAGSIAAAQLALGGADVVAIEAGGRYGRRDFPPDQLATDVRGALTRGKTLAECPTVRSSVREVAKRPTLPALTMNAVGGTKHHSGNGHLRMPEWQFRSRSATIERYGAGAIPASSTLADWPISYQDLAPFYDKLEELYGVSGEAGANPFEGPRSGPYPLPPLRRAGYLDLMEGAARELGWHPFPAPAAIRSRPYRGMGACTYCGHCVLNGCWADAKGVGSLVGLPEALASGNLRLLTDARVVEMLVNDDGLAQGVAYLHGGVRQLQEASVVVLAGFTYENVRLLLLSRAPELPRGLSNQAGQVGRHFTTHQINQSFGTFRGRALNSWTGSTSQASAIADFEADNFDHSGLGFIGGGVIQAMMETKILQVARLPPPGVPRWGSAYKRWLARDLRSTGLVMTLLDEQPNADSLLDLDPSHTDDIGLPVIRVTRAPTSGDREGHAFLTGKAEEWLRAAGANEAWTLPFAPVNVSSHAFGGARMGLDPGTSVVDAWCMSHEVPNLAVLGGAVFPSATGSNPTPTIEALAWRTAEHLLGSWSGRAAP